MMWKKQPSRGAHGIDLFVKAAEPHSSLLEALDDRNQIFKGASQAIETPDHQKYPLPCMPEIACSSPGRSVFAPESFVLVDVFRMNACCVESIPLELKFLVVC